LRTAVLSALTLLTVLASACGAGAPVQPTPRPTPSTAAVQATSAFPVSVTDDAGRTLTLAREPQRIVSLASSNTEILFALGLGDRVVGVDQYSDFPPPAREKPRVGSFVKPDMEKILALEPDLVLATEMHVKTALPDLEKRGLATMVVTPKGVKAVLDAIKLVGKATGRQKEAEELTSTMAARIAAVEARSKGSPSVRTFFELSPELHTAGPGSFVDDMIRLAGGSNIAAGAGKEWPQLSQEALLVADPEVILLADHGSSGGQSPQSVAARPGWQQITAVKMGRVYEIDPDLTNRPGPRVVDGLEMIADKLHPTR